MGYRRMNVNDLKEIHRRLMSGQSLKAISEVIGYDRKTLRVYREAMDAVGLLSDQCPDTEEALSTAFFNILPTNKRRSPVTDQFTMHRDEIKELITRDENPLKPKSAYLVIRERYDITGSYESFKVFIRDNHIQSQRKKPFPRLELPAGLEIQIDYLKCGLHIDPATGKRRVVYAFVAKLTFSRLPFVEFTYTQSQESFVESNIHMVLFFGGVTEFLTIDNLKAGVIKPSIYEPQLNRAYAEFAEHYSTFINPCLPGHAKGKAKVERQVPEVRELFRRLVELHPTYSLKELNPKATTWCREEYGGKPHGTTGVAPWKLFIREEQPKLRSLPPVRFEVPIWKPATVHEDQFISFKKMRFSLPKEYRRQEVYCRYSNDLLKIISKDDLLIRQYVVTNKKIYSATGDFPESFEAMMKGSYPQYLIRQAAEYGSGAKKLVESVLKPHAFLNARRVQGFLRVIKEYKDVPLLQDICYKAAERQVKNPKQLAVMLEDEQNQNLLPFVLPRSETGEAMIRDISEYL